MVVWTPKTTSSPAKVYVHKSQAVLPGTVEPQANCGRDNGLDTGRGKGKCATVPLPPVIVTAIKGTPSAKAKESSRFHTSSTNPGRTGPWLAQRTAAKSSVCFC